MSKLTLDLAAYATTHGQGPFYPAIRRGTSVFYWPNITCKKEDEAYERASLALKDAYDAANAVASQWNVYKV